MFHIKQNSHIDNNFYILKMKKISVLFALLVVAVFAKAQTPTISAEECVVVPGELNREVLILNLSESMSTYCGYDFQVYPSDGLTVTGTGASLAWRVNETEEVWDEDEEDYVTTVVANHASQRNKIEGTENAYKYIVFDGSIHNASFNDTPQIIRLNVRADADFTEGTITFKSFTLSSATDASKDFTVEEFVVVVKAAATTVTFTMTDAGWGTLILPFEADVPEGLTAYTCETAAAKSELDLVKATSLAANTPYIMEGTAGTYEFTGTATNTEKEYTVGALTGFLEEATAPAGSYVLQKQGDKVAFFKVGEAGKTVGANRCYLNVTGAGATMYRLGGTTGIQAVYAEENCDVYDMLGRKVLGPLEKGVYIKNNRKFYVK